MKWPRPPIVDDARNWYKFTSVQAAMLLAFLEALQSMHTLTLPPWATIGLALVIPVLRVWKQNLK